MHTFGLAAYDPTQIHDKHVGPTRESLNHDLSLVWINNTIHHTTAQPTACSFLVKRPSFLKSTMFCVFLKFNLSVLTLTAEILVRFTSLSALNDAKTKQMFSWHPGNSFAVFYFSFLSWNCWIDHATKLVLYQQNYILDDWPKRCNQWLCFSHVEHIKKVLCVSDSRRQERIRGTASCCSTNLSYHLRGQTGVK